MTKAKTKVVKEPPLQYVVLRKILYKAMLPKETEVIEPAADPYAADSRRITLDHLPKADVKKVIMLKIVAPDKTEPVKKE